MQINGSRIYVNEADGVLGPMFLRCVIGPMFLRCRGVMGFVVSWVSWFHGFRDFIGFVVSGVSWCRGFISFMAS